MLSANMFPSSVNIATKSTAVSNLDTTVTYSVTTSNVPALVTDASAALQLLYAQRNIVVDHVVYLGQSVTLNTGDIIQFGSRNFFAHRCLDVSGTGRVFEVHCSEAQNIIYEE